LLGLNTISVAPEHQRKGVGYIPCNGEVLRELDRARNTKTLELEVRVLPT
jgi:hypothetical protein